MIYFLGSCLLSLVYLPLVSLLKIILFFVPKVRERIQFENKNALEKGAASFKLDGIRADLCFEFSSEGEYQQVASLIEDSLAEGKKLELVFFSPSVEKTILELYKRYPNQIRYLRYPFLSLKFSSWISASTLVLVRYDLFPEFLVWSLGKGRTLKLVWISFKKERIQGKSPSFMKKAFLRASQVKIFSSEADALLGGALGFKGSTYDFRMEQIKRRILNREEKFTRLFVLYPEFKSLLTQYPRHKRLILGNAWPQDIFLLSETPSDVLVVIVPHQLNEEIISSIQKELNSFGRRAEIVTDETPRIPEAKTIIIQKKGILCELYQDFGKAYVGGGFGVSVHSILEPLVAGSEHLSCGPVNFRSTEFDLAQGLGNLKEVKNPQEFKDWLSEDILSSLDRVKLEDQLHAYPAFKKEILS